jgi:NADPH-dependent ferric siderophore reductase
MSTPRPKPSQIGLVVLRTERISPNLHRVVLGGDGFDQYVDNEFTDRYVKLVLPRPGTTLPEPLDLERLRAELPKEQWPVLRTYTVRWSDGDARELAIDFAIHGEEGIAAPWAIGAKPGDRLYVLGPGGAYQPRHDADWHLFMGDESALPAIAAAVDQIRDTRPMYLIVELAHIDDCTYLDLPSRAVVRWLVRGGGTSLLDAVRDLEFPSGRVQAFVHGELGMIREMKPYLRDARGIPADYLSISGYWRVGKDEDGFQAEKAEESRAATSA